MALKLKYTSFAGDFQRVIEVETKEVIASAATGAMKEAGDRIKKRGRESIAAGGFGPKWQNQLRVDIYPKSGKPSINAAAHIYHKIPFAGIFEYGGTVHGRPLMWIPIDANLPFRAGGKRWTPSLYQRQYGALYSVRGASKPLLVGRAPGKDGNVPLFVGVRQVTIPKKFDVTSVVDEVANGFSALYEKHVKVD